MEPNERSVIDPGELYKAWCEFDDDQRGTYDFGHLEELLPEDLQERRAALYGLHKMMLRHNRDIRIWNEGFARMLGKASPSTISMMMKDTVDTECMRLQNMVAETERAIEAQAATPEGACPRIGIISSLTDVKRIFEAMEEGGMISVPIGGIKLFVEHLFKEGSRAKDLRPTWDATRTTGNSRSKAFADVVKHLTDSLPSAAIDDLLSHLERKRAKTR